MSIFGWNYPPGVSGADIDRHFGEDRITGLCDCGGDLFNGAEDCDTCLAQMEAEDEAEAESR